MALAKENTSSAIINAEKSEGLKTSKEEKIPVTIEVEKSKGLKTPTEEKIPVTIEVEKSEGLKPSEEEKVPITSSAKCTEFDTGETDTASEQLNTCESCGQQFPNKVKPAVVTIPDQSKASDLCRICHGEAEPDQEQLITPCQCKGSLACVHHSCLQKWINSSGLKQCELCGFQFVMQSKLKPFSKWEMLKMSPGENKRIWCSVLFNVVALICVVWSLYVLIERTAHELKSDEMQWPFWTKLAVVIVGLLGGIAFLYVQLKAYYRLWKRLITFNKVVHVQNQPNLNRASASRTEIIEIPVARSVLETENFGAKHDESKL